MIYFSNDIYSLCKVLSQELYQNRLNPFDQKIILVPSDRYKRLLQEYFAKDTDSGVAMGLKIQSLPEYLFSLGQGKYMPSLMVLQMRVFAETRKHLPDYSISQIKTLSQTLAHLFARYGLCEQKQIKQWLQIKGWKQLIWKKIFEEGSWVYPSKMCEAIKEIEEPPLLFGFSSMPASIGLFFKRTQSKMFLFSPCRMFWSDLYLHEERSPLLAWGKWGQRFLNACNVEEMSCEEEYLEPQDGGTLSALQKSILDLQPCGASDGIKATIRIFSAKDRQAEVEELFDRISRLLNSHDELKPSDILVLAPDLASYAPHIHASFTQREKLFDYAICGLDRKSSPLAKGISLFFELIEEHWDGKTLTSLFANPLFSAKRKWKRADLELIERWLTSAKMTWGLEKIDFSLDRLLFGLCTTDSDAAVMPSPAIGWADADLFASLIQTLEDLRESLKVEKEMTFDECISILLKWYENYFEDEEEEWFKEELGRLAIVDFGSDEAIYTWHELKAICEDLFSKRTEGFQRHLLEAVHFDAFEEGNVLPKKVIALLGTDDQSFPRSDSDTSLDEMEPKLVSKNEIDRYLFLEAILKAKEQLIVSFLHVCPKQGIELSPSLLITELQNFVGNLTIDRLEEGFEYKEEYFSESRYRLAVSYDRRQKSKNTFARDWKEFEELPSLILENAEVDLADLQLLLKDPLELFFKKNLRFVLPYKEETPFYDEDFLIGKFERQALIEKGLKTTLSQALSEREKEKGAPYGIFRQAASLKLEREFEETKKGCERNGVDFTELKEIEIPSLEIQWDEKTKLTLKGGVDRLSSAGLVELHYETPSSLSVLRRWPELLVLGCLKEFDKTPKQIVLAYAKKNAIRDFSHLDFEGELRKLLYYYFMSLKRLTPLYPKCVEPIFKSDSSLLMSRMKDIPSRYMRWLVQRDGEPQFETLCQTWGPICKTTFSSLYGI